MKRYAPATARNSEPIAEVLQRELPQRGAVLEIASGSGEHAVFFARRFPELIWQPSDPDPDALSSITEWADEAGLSNLKPALTIDASAVDWPVDHADAVVCINMVHISPWEATLGLIAGSGRLLAAGAPLVLYGPYREDDVETAPSNLAFDAGLRERDPRWGLRNLSDVDAAAQEVGFERMARHRMPANNLTLVYRKPAAV